MANGWTQRRDMPPDWKQRREVVAARAGGRCEAVENGARCPDQGSECHHAGDPGDHRLEMLQWLCTEHHAVITHEQAAEALRRRNAKVRYPLRRAPGLL